MNLDLIREKRIYRDISLAISWIGKFDAPKTCATQSCCCVNGAIEMTAQGPDATGKIAVTGANCPNGFQPTFNVTSQANTSFVSIANTGNVTLDNNNMLVFIPKVRISLEKLDSSH